MTDSVSENDDDDEHDGTMYGLGSRSIDSTATRKRKLNPIAGPNKRMHLDRRTTGDYDSDSNSEHNDRAAGSTENDDGDSSRMSHLDDGE